jgi:hypothetical protein
MTTYKEVFQLAQSKGYDSILCTMARYGGSATLPHNVTDAASELCELALIQKWLRDDKGIYVTTKHFHDILEGAGENEMDIHQTLWEWEVVDTNNDKDWIDFSSGEYHHTYEESLLEGINEALKLI